MGRLNSIILCTRLNSRRVPGKALREINGKPCLHHLLDRLLLSEIPIIVAVPWNELPEWQSKLVKYNGQLDIIAGSEDDPLDRMATAARHFNVQHVIRVTHDKIFVDPASINYCFDQYMKRDLDYLYSSTFTSGTGFEIISKKALDQANEQYKKVEHISYAIKAVTKNKFNLDVKQFQWDHRLLLDYEEDFTLAELILATLGNDCNTNDVCNFLDDNPWAANINKLPLLSVYTCAYNAEKWLDFAMSSVSQQMNFDQYEYILVDDHSTDDTPYLMAKFKSKFPNVKYIRNGQNLGLASSSNIALTHARAPYIMRLDADDFFVATDVCRFMLGEIKKRNLDAIYPNNYLGDYGVVQKGREHHHIGGALFNTRAVNHIKFTEGLRGYEGLDFFGRAKSQLKIGYINKPLFFYRQHEGSLSKNNKEEREKIKAKIMEDMYEEEIPRH